MPAGEQQLGPIDRDRGSANPDPSNPPSADYRTATPRLFAALQIPIRSGRGFTDADRADTQPVAIVSEVASPGATGRTRIRSASGCASGTDPWMTVVGVCGDVIHGWFDRRNTSDAAIVRSRRRRRAAWRSWCARPRDPATVAAEARAAVRAVDPAQPVFELQPMRTTLHERTLGLHYVGAIMFAFGGLALLLAVIGVYGVMAYDGDAAHARDRRADGARRHAARRAATDCRTDRHA